jgi:hypothetical protein
VRLSPQHAAILWGLVREEKMANTRVVLTGAIPGGPGQPVAKRGVDPYGDDVYVTSEPLPSHWRARDPRGNEFPGFSYLPERSTRGSGFGEVLRERRY